ncbi:novel plant snare [Striga asiatica]|uniref:Novel plant snare n=1 Tax=Striga asiatica TaxID=4170 RepID=A0A5A7R1Z0_STRAF|nr:novel plant snare [Striga asiatica]
MAGPALQMNPQMEQIHGEIRDTIRALGLIKEFDREIKDEESRNPAEVNKQLSDEKQSMIKELNSYVALRKTYMNKLGGKRVELFDMGTGPSEPIADENVQVASEMSNQELVNAGMKTMDETDQAIERSKQVVPKTIESFQLVAIFVFRRAIFSFVTNLKEKGGNGKRGNGFQKLDKIKDSNRQSKQLEELTGKMRECKRSCEEMKTFSIYNLPLELCRGCDFRLIKEFDLEIKEEESRNPPGVTKQLNDEKQSMIKELNSYVALRKTYMSTLGGKRVELFDMGNGYEPQADENVRLASEMSNQELVDVGMKTMDETDQAIERSKQVVHQTIEVGTQTAATLKGQTEQMARLVDELDKIQFSIKRASKLVKEIGRQVATDKCIMLLLFLIVCGVIAIIIVKIVNPNNRDIRDIPGLAPPVPTRRLLFVKEAPWNNNF